ncbi:hypothetical protein UFOVP447_21 [uncultured Caudovirales phage]|uniref:Uncharacterized protein n=1 Tax=uncultured Caudovirales phage TaxID=2100421 RepID=A0A6J5M8Z2_9CAUD|nr:hypothetical protein UFOVP447_21 [uncultured Caudovirales phage]
MIKVYQIQLTDAEIDMINNSDVAYTNPKIKAYFERLYETTFKAENFEHYTHVANVYTDDMDIAYREMNLWEDVNMVETFTDRNCSSMSIGDILEMEDGSLHRVSTWGFTALPARKPVD